MRVHGCQILVRNESDRGYTIFGNNLPTTIPREKGLSVSTPVGTRKVCELYVWRLKPIEILVEGRIRSDVQIDGSTCIKGRKTNRTT